MIQRVYALSPEERTARSEAIATLKIIMQDVAQYGGRYASQVQSVIDALENGGISVTDAYKRGWEIYDFAPACD